ncbi:uncharacterized protein LOC132295144 [Cornus florida]|uniref:uncharacterized protein LOC132295144 n=1 Tax=Cornus florida TaxID=4283 RepID=UPI00289E6456|nr:uncharacterized protein LOC132295144 [Cornus florida]XP_059649256.1 uncharacterized protein LOC132295144 [Cornus florida]XP_059649257.1 uncharacterized protein LOC132295144 [Cornus florida]
MMYGDQHHHHLQQQQPHPQHPPPPPPPPPQQQRQPMMGEYLRGPQLPPPPPPPPPPPMMRQPSASSTTLNAPEYHHQPPAQHSYDEVVVRFGRFFLLGHCLIRHFADKNRKFEIRCKEHKAELKILSTPEGVRTDKFRGSETTVFECPYCPRKGVEELESRPVLDSDCKMIALDVDLEYLLMEKDAVGKRDHTLHDFDPNEYFANCARTNFTT